MYRPPENANRVKAIKSKFESCSENTTPPAKPPLRKARTLQEFNVREKPKVPEEAPPSLSGLSRQLSDPSKRNIKRTPAFRLDRNVQERPSVRLLNNRRLVDNKISKFNSAIQDNNENAVKESNKPSASNATKSNFTYIRNKFDNKAVNKEINNEQNKTEVEVEPSKLLKYLYTEPVPKSKRNKQNDAEEIADIYHSDTLKLGDSKDVQKNTDSSTHKSTGKILNKQKSLENVSVGIGPNITDTLKNALRKPLPKGPAPRKPPRTFQHSPVAESKNKVELRNKTDLRNKTELNNKTESRPQLTERSSLSLDKNFPRKLSSALAEHKKSKGDAKYMLDKLEIALKSKGILSRKPKQSSTSEEDSDSEKKHHLFRRDLPEIPRSSQTLPIYYSSPPPTSPKFNFNCLNLGCVTSAYEPAEPNSTFFVRKEEPVYAEPFEYQEVESVPKNGNDSVDGVETPTSRTIRRSVHYASSPIPELKPGEANSHVSEQTLDQVASDSSSISMSDMDSSAVSTPSEESKVLVSAVRVKDLIKAIENGKNNIQHAQKEEDRVKKLEMQLKSTLDKSFSSAQLESSALESDANDDDGESKREDEFETYVKRVRSKIFCRSGRKKEHLFHCCLLVALNRSTPYVKSKFPENVEEPNKIADLCFPEVESGAMDTSAKAQCYSLIITNEKGERTFGYCRRVLPEASTECLPLAYCILSKHRAPGFYRRVLEELEVRHGYPDKFRQAFLEELYNCKFPQPGETIAIDCSRIISSLGEKILKNGRACCCSTKETQFCETQSDYNTPKKRECGCSEKGEEGEELDLKSFVIVCNSGDYGTLVKGSRVVHGGGGGPRGSATIYNIPHEIHPTNLKRCSSSPTLPADLESLPSELVFVRPHDSRHEENDLKLLGETLKMPVLQPVFCSLLLERKVVLVSSVLSKLSSCIEALQIILYPFCWQHTIIPVLPRCIWEIVDTPTPLLCGVLSVEVVNNYIIENAVVVDLDEGAILQQVGDEDKILPSCLIQTLKDGLSLANKVSSDKAGISNIFLSDAFLRVFIQSCGHYKEHVIDGMFKKPEFIQNIKVKGKRIRNFLKWFTETSMFYNFVEEALNGSSSLDLFDQRIKIYTSDSATEILNKMKYWSSYKSLVGSNLSRFH